MHITLKPGEQLWVSVEGLPKETSGNNVLLVSYSSGAGLCPENWADRFLNLEFQEYRLTMMACPSGLVSTEGATYYAVEGLPSVVVMEVMLPEYISDEEDEIERIIFSRASQIGWFVFVKDPISVNFRQVTVNECGEDNLQQALNKLAFDLRTT
jgi:hypothetical protein